MAVVVASARLSDDEFLAAFASCQLAPESFRHGDHLRLAWLEVHRKPIAEALAVVREGIRKYATHWGQSQLFHETITEAWVRLIATHSEASFEQFLAQNEPLLTMDLLHRFWTPAVLQSEAARAGWVPPDKRTLPHAGERHATRP